MHTPVGLSKPNQGRSGALALSRVSDRLTFLYLDLCRVEQDHNGTHARIEISEEYGGGVRTTYLPVATMACLLLGPGTSISGPAAAALARNGCAVVFAGSGAVRGYSSWSPISGSTSLLESQAAVVCDPVRRVEVARKMFLMRFPDNVLPDGPISLEQLRGLEGVRMKATYQLEAQRRRLTKWRRRTGEEDGKGPLDAVNEALNHANVSLYGLCLSVICALGMSPGLGVVHSGNPRAFVLDIADLYKTRTTIPLAFRQVEAVDPRRDVMRALRDEFMLLRLLPQIVDDLHILFGEQSGREDWDLNELYLWDENRVGIAAGWNRSGIDRGFDK
jgi:CRISP-associated protein Cas1